MTYPTFYRAVHDAYGLFIVEHSADLPWCGGDPEHYDPREHECYTFAGELRVALHAAGIGLSTDGRRAGVARVNVAAPPRLHDVRAEGYAAGLVDGRQSRG